MDTPGVKRGVFGRHALMLRSYLLLVVGLLLVAVVLDLGFRYLQSKTHIEADPWLASSLTLVEASLAAVPPEQRAAALTRLREASGLDIRLLPRADVASAAAHEGGVDTLVDADGAISYLYPAPALDTLIYVGPVEIPRESLLPRLLTPLFYLSIFVVAGLWLRPLLRDINQITSAAQRFAADYREPLATAQTTTRLTGLAGNLDDMSARLSGLIQSQKELIAALSHEMRTPLARIRFALAVIDSRDNATLRAQLAALNADVQEVDDLIGTMLSYARLDHPDLRMSWQNVPIKAWLEDAAARWQDSGKTLTVRPAAEAEVVTMDRNLMSLALSNLLSNAVRHAASQVHCMVARHGDSWILSVEDDGAGIPGEQRDAVFKAFTRLDDSRNRETGGVGLGLAVVARIAALHRGCVRVDVSDELGGARFVLAWPAAQ